VDDGGKRYRARKTVLPSSMAGGPKGLGDPNDRSLRRNETELLIPNRVKEEIENVECRLDFLDMVNCIHKEGDLKATERCHDPMQVYWRCKRAKLNDPEFRQRITEKYLDERAEYRRTGLSRSEMKDYRRWKQEKDREREA